VLEECEYFGYVIYTKEITDIDIIRFYKPKVYQTFHDIIPYSIRALRTIHRAGLLVGFTTEIDRHTKLIEDISYYWD
jgi:hypothetical protein